MRIPVVIIGAGQAGLAMSHELVAHSIDHIVLERHDVANSWRTERWDSLRLLTPNWMTRLPGYRYAGDDPDGFMACTDVVAFLDGCRRGFDAPVQTQTAVAEVRACAAGFEVTTNQGTLLADVVVAAAGACSEPYIPPVAAELPAGIAQLTALQYRNPNQVGAGPVLVVGASASGAQIADELRRSGREVTVAVGDHVRLPRTYRGCDIHWWMDAIGQLDERHDEVDDVNRARHVPSLQLIGSPERRTLDLNTLAAIGVRVVGRLMRVAGGKAQFSGAIANLVANADLKQNRLLDRIDEFVSDHGLGSQLADDDPVRPAATNLGMAATELPVREFATVIWATGYRPTYPWLDDAALDRRGRLRHNGGVGEIPGLHFLGLPFMRRRRSSFIDGVGPDAADLYAHIRAHLGHRRA